MKNEFEAAQLLQQGIQHFRVGQLDLAADSFHEALRISKVLGNQVVEGVALTVLGNVYLNQNKYQQAIDVQEQALALSKEIGNYAGQGAALGGLGLAYLKQGQTKQGTEYLESALPIFKQIGDRAGECQVLSGLGNAHTQSEEYSTAIKYHQQALTAAREIGNSVGEATALGGLGEVYLKQGQYQKAIDSLKPVLPIFREMGNRLWQGETHINLAKAYDSLQQYAEAISHYEQAFNIFQDSGDLNKIVNLLLNLGSAQGQLGQHSESASSYQRALSAFQDNDDQEGEGKALLNLGITCSYLVQYSEGIRFLSQALSIFQNLGDLKHQGIILERLGYTHMGSGQFTEAISFFQQGLAIVRMNYDRLTEGKILSNLGYALTQKGEYQQALEHLNQALSIAHELSSSDLQGQSLSFLGNLYLDQRKYKEAIETQKYALSILRNTDNTLGQAAALGCIGLAYLEQNEYQQGIKHLEEALPIFNQTGYQFGECQVLNGLGNAYLQLDDHSKAINYFQQVLDITGEINNGLAEATALSGLGYVYVQQEQYQKAINSFRSVLSILQDIDISEVDRLIYLNLAKSYVALEESSEPIQFLDKELKVIRELETKLRVLAEIQYDIGTNYLHRSENKRSENLELSIYFFKESLQVYSKAKYPSEWAAVQNNLSIAYLYRIQGGKAENIEEAINYSEATLEIYTSEETREEWARTQLNLSNIYLARILGEKVENLQFSINFCKRALSVFTKNEFPEYWVKVQSNLGSAYATLAKQSSIKVGFLDYVNQRRPQVTSQNFSKFSRSNYEKAKQAFLENAIESFALALETVDEIALPLDRAQIQTNLGVAFLDKSEFIKSENCDELIDQSINYLESALRSFTPNETPEKWAEVNNHIAVAYIKKLKSKIGNKTEILRNSVSHFQDTLQIYTREAFPQKYAETQHNLGRAYKYAENYSAAYDAFYEVIETLDYLRSQISPKSCVQEDKQKLTEAWSHVYQDMVQLCLKLKKPIEALEYVERSKTKSLVEILTNKVNFNKNETSLNRIHDIGRISFVDIQDLIDDRTAIIEWYIAESQIFVFIITHHTPYPIICKSSPDDWTNWLDAYFTYSLAYQVEKETKEVERRKREAERLGTEGKEPESFLYTFYQELVNQYQQKEQWSPELENRFSTWKNNFGDKLRNIAKALQIDGILEEIPSECDQLVIVPNRWLHLIPLHALPISSSSGQDGTELFLLDRFSGGIRYAPSCQLLKLSQHQIRSDFENLFAFQNPTLDLGMADLEVGKVREFFSSPTVLARENATKSNLWQQNFSVAHCIHFACHGEYNLDFPLESKLFLAQEDEDNGQLTLEEIFELKLSQCRLVTLSACETGSVIEFFSNSDEYITLASGFLCAGSSGVVSSLWEVDDLATACLMMRFYENLQTGCAVSIALNQAQKWLRKLTRKELDEVLEKSQKFLSPAIRIRLRRRQKNWSIKFPEDHRLFQSPYYWAAFCAVGQ